MDIDSFSPSPHPSDRPGRRVTASRRAVHVVAALAAAGLLVAPMACSSDDAAGPTTTVAQTRPAPPASPAPSNTPPSIPPPTTSQPTTSPPTTSPPPTTAPEDPARRAMLEGILQSHLAAHEFVGARIALRDRDGTITEATAGTQTTDPASAPVDPSVPWNIGSATKTFVAVVVLQLAEEGRLDLDAGIDGFVPDLPGAERITPRQLLQHTSGLGEYIDQPAVLADPMRSWTPAELLAVAEAGGRVGEPGGPHHYSNTNYIVLGEIVEQVTGNPWADEVRTRIVEPLGLTATSEMTDPRPVGYRIVDDSFVDSTFAADASIGGAAGAMQSTGRDLLLFAVALADGTLLNPESMAAMRTFVPAEDYSQFGIEHGYGLGLEEYANDALTLYGHMGTGEAQSAYVGYDPQNGTAVAVGTNTAESGPQAIMGFEALLMVAGEG